MPAGGSPDGLDRRRKNPFHRLPGPDRIKIPYRIETINHIAVLWPAKLIGVDGNRLMVVIFNSSIGSVTATIRGYVDVVIITPFAPDPCVKSGDLRYLIAATENRVGGLMAGVPTWREFGCDIVVTSRPKIVVPHNLKPDQIACWDKAFAAITATPSGRA
ncbi:hypothetical protein [Azospirillum endophyticum]